MRFELSRDYWKRHVEHRRHRWLLGGGAETDTTTEQGGDGAVALQSLRAVVPHRT
jgi:hypothetical protein